MEVRHSYVFLVWISGKLLLIIIYFSSGQVVGGQVDGDDIARSVQGIGFRHVPGVGPGRGSLKFVVEMKQDGSFVGGGGVVVGFGSFGGSGPGSGVVMMLGASDLFYISCERRGE